MCVCDYIIMNLETETVVIVNYVYHSRRIYHMYVIKNQYVH